MEIKEENIKKAYNEGCSNVKKVLENLFPDAFTSEKLTFEEVLKLPVNTVVFNEYDEKYQVARFDHNTDRKGLINLSSSDKLLYDILNPSRAAYFKISK